MTEPVARLFQPNLTCAFDLTKNEDGSVWTLVVRNHEKAGICDEQLVEQIWDFANVFTHRLQESKAWDLKQDQPIPPVNAIMTHCSRFMMFNFIIASENGEPLSASMITLVLAQLAADIASQKNIKLRGMTNGTKAPSAHGN